jgi:3-oxoacyl-[acyl-carrier-protein] synthase II
MLVKRVVITGIGTINPIGDNPEDYFSNLDLGVSGSTLITRFDTSLFKTKFACEIRDYSPERFGLDIKEARKHDIYTQYALIAADQAITDSRIPFDEETLRRTGVIIGSGIGGVETLTREIMDYTEGQPPRFSPFFVPKIITNIASGSVSIKYGFRGPNFSTTSACTSSANALCVAASMIQLGKADIMIAGGSEAPITVIAIGGFNSMRALSTNNDSYQTASRPFDATRDGFVIGEGAGILVLEEYEHALNRGANIYAEIIGYGQNADAYHITAPSPEGVGASESMRIALEDAGIAPDQVDYINTHGTSTPLGDIAELDAIKRVFGDTVNNINLSSTKSMTGHLLGAAGAVEAIACIHAIRDGIIPPTINFREKDEAIDYSLNLTFNTAQKRNVRVAMSNNFGFGGHNATIVFAAPGYIPSH